MNVYIRTHQILMNHENTGHPVAGPSSLQDDLGGRMKWYRWYVLFVMFLVYAANALDRVVVSVLAPYYQR